MAYGFEQKQAKNDPDVELYLNENMLFEAWTMIILHWEGDFDGLYEQLEREYYKKQQNSQKKTSNSYYIF